MAKPLPDMKDRKKRPRIPKDLSKEDKQACKILIKNPEATNAEIGRELVKSGTYSTTNHIYHRLKRSEKLRLTLSQLREYELETFVRNNVPTASRNLKRGLKDRQLKTENPSIFYKLTTDALKIGLGHNDSPAPVQPQVNIGQIQVAIQQTLADTSNKDSDK